MEELHEKAQYLDVSDEQDRRIMIVREMFSSVYKDIDRLLKPSRETSLAITKIEEAQFWTIKSISREN